MFMMLNQIAELTPHLHIAAQSLDAFQAATLPDGDPQAPPGLEGMWPRIIGVGKWIALAVCILGLLGVAGKMAWDSRRGETSEEISGLVKIAFAVVIVSGATSFIGFISGN